MDAGAICHVRGGEDGLGLAAFLAAAQQDDAIHLILAQQAGEPAAPLAGSEALEIGLLAYPAMGEG